MSRDVYILGGAQTDFARNWAREGLEIYDMFAEVLRALAKFIATENRAPEQPKETAWHP